MVRKGGAAAFETQDSLTGPRLDEHYGLLAALSLIAHHAPQQKPLPVMQGHGSEG